MGIGRRRITTLKKIETAPRPYTELALGTQDPGISGFHDFWTWKIHQLGGIMRSHRVVGYYTGLQRNMRSRMPPKCLATQAIRTSQIICLYRRLEWVKMRR